MIQLETPRLTIRGFKTSDAQALHAIVGDPEIVKHVGDGQPISLERCEKWIVISNANYERQHYGAMAVIENSSLRLIGYCGLVFGDDKTTPEIIYGFIKTAWGQGYATEAATAMLEHGFQGVKLEKILGIAYSENKPSLKILGEKLGFGYTHTQTEENGLTTAYFVLEREDWLQSHAGLVSA